MAPSQQDSAVRQASRSNHVSALAVGIVLLLGAGWYYLSARSASEHLARNSFRQLNNLADQADAVMVNFPHLFNFLPVASTASGAVRRNAPDPQADCTLAALSAEGSGLPRYLECQLLASGERDATRTAAAREALATIAQVRKDHRDNEIRYRRSLQGNRMLASLSMRWVDFKDSLCKGSEARPEVAGPHFDLTGAAGQRELVVTDCPADGKEPLPARRLPSAHLPFGALFDSAGLNFDFDQFAVLDAEGGLLYLSTARLGKGRHDFGRLPDTSEFARLLKLDIDKMPAPTAGAGASAAGGGERYTRILKRRFGDTDYTVFVQPHVPALPPAAHASGAASWYVVGLKETSRFNAERFHVGPLQFALFSFALLLAIAVLPAVRLLFLGRGTSLSRFDFSVLVVSLVIATGSAVMLGLIVNSSTKLGVDTDATLEQLAGDLKRALDSELRAKAQALDKAESTIIASYQALPAPLAALLGEARDLEQRSPLYQALAANHPALRFAPGQERLSRDDVAALLYLASDEPLYRDVTRALLANPAWLTALPDILTLQRHAHAWYDGLVALDAHNVDPACANPSTSYTLTDQARDSSAPRAAGDYALAWLIDENGDQVFGQLNNRRGQLRHLNVPSREYFKRARDGQVWHPAWAGPQGIYVERVWSRSEGRKTTILARPLATQTDNMPPALRACGPRVAALMTNMRALTAAVLPANYGYAVIADQSGEVLFHANDEAALIENFYTETNNDKALLAATEHDQDEHFTSFYSDGWIQGFVTAVPGMPWSVVVYHDNELSASIIFEAAVLAFVPVLAIALLILLGMELQHALGYTIANAWWPHPDNALRHALTAAISIAYAIALFRNLSNRDGLALVTQPLLIGPVLFAYLSSLWAEASLRKVLLVVIPLVALTWGFMLDGVEFAMLALALAGVILALSRVARIAQMLRPYFRTVHAIAGIGLFTAVAGVPVFGFYQDAVSYYLTREADFANAWTRHQVRTRGNALSEYCQTLRDGDKLPGECAPPPRYDENIVALRPAKPCAANATEPPCDYQPKDSFAYAAALMLKRNLAPYSDQNAMLRPLSGAPGLNAPVLRRPDVSRYLDSSAMFLILACTSLFLGLVSWLTSRRLFGLQGAGAFSFLPAWPVAADAHNERPALQLLQRPSLLVGYSPSAPELAEWATHCAVLPWHALDNAADSARPLVVTGLEFALKEIDAARAAACRDAITTLLARGAMVTLVCEVQPDFFIHDAVANGIGHLGSDGAAQFAWLDLIDRFERLGAPLRWEGGATRSDVIDDELSTFPELQIHGPAIKQRARDAARPVQLLAVIFRVAESVYFRKWSASTLREQAVLLQLVRRELVNPDQHDVLESLLNRGLIVREPRIRIASRTFQWFVENVEVSRELDQFSVRYQDSLWQSMRWPVIMVLGLFALFLFQSGDDKMQWVIASLGSVITLGTTLRQLWSLIKDGGAAAQ
ncbi:MAG: cache domain-containing protein [Gammaproteobacteria bacterium]|nr:cache domain-containing protein [Gammaproteobacteria bacterium]